MSRSDPQSRGKIVDRATPIERAVFDEAQRARNAGRSPAPGGCSRRRLGSTTQTWSEARRLCRSGTQPETAIDLFRNRCGTDGTTKHTGRLDAGKEAAVEARIANAKSAVATFGIESGMVQGFLRSLRSTRLAFNSTRVRHFRTSLIWVNIIQNR